MGYCYFVNKKGEVKSSLAPSEAFSSEELLKIFNRSLKEDFIYVSDKLEQVVVYNDETACTAYFPKGFDKQKIIEIINTKENENYSKITIVGPKEHTCPVCGMVAQGTDKTLLCKECRTTFGHATVDEL